MNRLAEPRRGALAAVERQTAILTRHFELLHRRTDIHDSLDRAEYLLLRALDESGPMRISALATLLGLDPSTAGRQVAALQAQGSVEREPDPADRRCTVVTPTPSGLERMRHVRRMRTEMVADLLAEWTDEDLLAFDAILGKYNRSVARRYLTGPAEPSPTHPA
ncbi:MarR family winged helix-turn-helix transcriptional regulator [Actinospica robiniae]|uniref:MarR family winged helix-turn-helix transcriptional regulator n=1 Tax=Actinospica robiniae TaxID=304901 RepID=UPI0004201EC2|nr:MarR family transcriptional regulator [Actinospica robiniae]